MVKKEKKKGGGGGGRGERELRIAWFIKFNFRSRTFI